MIGIPNQIILGKKSNETEIEFKQFGNCLALLYVGIQIDSSIY